MVGKVLTMENPFGAPMENPFGTAPVMQTTAEVVDIRGYVIGKSLDAMTGVTLGSDVVRELGWDKLPVVRANFIYYADGKGGTMEPRTMFLRLMSDARYNDYAGTRVGTKEDPLRLRFQFPIHPRQAARSQNCYPEGDIPFVWPNVYLTEGQFDIVNIDNTAMVRIHMPEHDQEIMDHMMEKARAKYNG